MPAASHHSIQQDSPVITWPSSDSTSHFWCSWGLTPFPHCHRATRDLATHALHPGLLLLLPSLCSRYFCWRDQPLSSAPKSPWSPEEHKPNPAALCCHSLSALMSFYLHGGTAAAPVPVQLVLIKSLSAQVTREGSTSPGRFYLH